MPQAVRAASAGVRNAAEFPRHDPPGYALIDARPTSPEEQGVGGARPCEGRPPVLPEVKCLPRPLSVGHSPLLVPFARHGEHVLRAVEMGAVRPHELADARTRGVEQFQQSPVPRGQRGGPFVLVLPQRRVRESVQHGGQRGGSDDLRQVACRAGAFEPGGRIVTQPLGVHGPVEERVHRGDAPGDRAAGQPPLVPVGEPAAQSVPVQQVDVVDARHAHPARQVRDVGGVSPNRVLAARALETEMGTESGQVVVERPGFRARRRGRSLRGVDGSGGACLRRGSPVRRRSSPRGGALDRGGASAGGCAPARGGASVSGSFVLAGHAGSLPVASPGVSPWPGRAPAE